MAAKKQIPQELLEVCEKKLADAATLIVDFKEREETQVKQLSACRDVLRSQHETQLEIREFLEDFGLKRVTVCDIKCVGCAYYCKEGEFADDDALTCQLGHWDGEPLKHQEMWHDPYADCEGFELKTGVLPVRQG
ncbi:hypothetical protein [Pararhizobium sp.]|uniref:hypothetical protein n=1 Tax=Pararhizobium sp. TaxID=1977563 RepID=UPI003D141028